jgi:kynurenine formamidase
MKLRSRLFAFILGVLGLVSCKVVSWGEVVDLTHSFDETTVYWPTEEGFKLIRGPAGVTEQGYYYAANRFMCAEHGGTHLDAPIHFFEKGETVDTIPVARFIGPGACVDVTTKCAGDRDYQVTTEDFQAWESANKASLEKRIVLIRTGYSRFWPEAEKYLGTKDRGKAAVAKLHFPGLDPAAAEWLVTRRHIRAVGIDTASIDHGQTRNYPTHQRLFRDNVPALENVADMSKLPASGFTVVALPMKIGGGSGAPCRIVAVMGNFNAPVDNRSALGLAPALSFAATSPATNSDATTVYVTTTGKKYHRADCKHLDKSKRAMSLVDAKRNYTPCKVCQPPQ